MTAAKKMKVRSTEKIKVLIADDDGQASRRAHDFLNQNGFDCRMVDNGRDAKYLLQTWQPKLLLIDLLLPVANALEVLQFCKTDATVRTLNVSTIVISGHNSDENIREAYDRGAKDYLTRPIMYNDLLSRVVFHCRTNRELESPKGDVSTDSLRIADLVISQVLQKSDFEETLYNITQIATMKLRGTRCSIVHQVTLEKGVVLASNDSKKIAGLELDLRKYPEMQLVTNSGKMVVIDNLSESRALAKIKTIVKEVSFNSMIVCPIYYHHKVFGVISMRMPSDQVRIPDRDIHFLEYVAKVVSLYISTQKYEQIAKYGLMGVT